MPHRRLCGGVVVIGKIQVHLKSINEYLRAFRHSTFLASESTWGNSTVFLL